MLEKREMVSTRKKNRNKHLMLIQHRKCQKGLMQPGATTRTVPKCDWGILELITHLKIFTSQTTIQQCWDGLKGWKLSFVNMGFGHRED